MTKRTKKVSKSVSQNVKKRSEKCQKVTKRGPKSDKKGLQKVTKTVSIFRKVNSEVRKVCFLTFCGEVFNDTSVYILRGFSGGSLELQYRVFFDPFLTFFDILTSFLSFWTSFLTFWDTLFDTFCHFRMTFCHFWDLFCIENCFSEVVGSARSQLFIPGFRHAHTLQQLKS